MCRQLSKVEDYTKAVDVPQLSDALIIQLSISTISMKSVKSLFLTRVLTTKLHFGEMQWYFLVLFITEENNLSIHQELDRKRLFLLNDKRILRQHKLQSVLKELENQKITLTLSQERQNTANNVRSLVKRKSKSRLSDKKGKKYMRVNLDLDEKQLFKKLQKKK